MKVLFLASTLPRFANDQQAPFVLEQAIAWAKARPKDQVYILAPHHLKAKLIEEVNDVKISRFPYFWPRKLQNLAYPAILPNIKRNPLLLLLLPFFLVSEYRAALKLVRKESIDLLYAHWVMPQGFIAYGVHKKLKVPYVLQNHSSDVRIFQKIPLGDKLLVKMIDHSLCFFCVNSRLKEEALAFFDRDDAIAISQKMKALPMGVYLSKISNSNGETKNKRIYEYDFGLIGRLSAKKGADLFINALSSLQKRNVKFKAAIAGDGEERQSLEALGKGLPVDFMGFVSAQKKAEFFDNVKFLIFPSVPSKGDVEGLPVALLESLYSSKMVIASRATNIELLPEWKDIQAGVLLLEDPANIERFHDLLKQLLNTEQATIDMTTQKNAQIINRYQWKNLIHEYIKFIDDRMSQRDLK